jgi:hypothetical protein
MIHIDERMIAESIGCGLVEGQEPPKPILKMIPHTGWNANESLGGRNPDDLAYLLVRAGRNVELVRFEAEHRPYYRVRDVPTGRWYVVEELTGYVFLVSS